MAALILSSKVVSAQQTPVINNDSIPNHVFSLGDVVVTGERNKPINSSLSTRTVQEFAKNDVSKALNLLPGVTLSAVGPRNEAMVYVRGFDLRQVPLLIDGIPVYVPYDGYVDLARFEWRQWLVIGWLPDRLFAHAY